MEEGQVLQEEMTLGVLVAFIGYIQMFFKPIRDISEKVQYHADGHGLHGTDF
jgi:ABC-type bacteriocin/lantibiotic exporter with double-glycine peptidase domain